MLFGRVRGTAICTIKYPDMKGMKLLVVEPLNKHLEPDGPLQVAVDVVMAGPEVEPPGAVVPERVGPNQDPQPARPPMEHYVFDSSWNLLAGKVLAERGQTRSIEGSVCTDAVNSWRLAEAREPFRGEPPEEDADLLDYRVPKVIGLTAHLNTESISSQKP